MGQRQAEVELTLLEYIVLSGSDRRWRFKAKPNPRFDQLMRDMITVHLFQIREVYFTLTSGDYSKQHAYEIHDDSMWFLSHLFVNWTGMFEKAKVHTSRTYQGQPRCSRCGQDCFRSCQCAHCNKTFCKICYDLHEFNLRQEQTHQTFDFRFEEVRADDFINFGEFMRSFAANRGTFTHTSTRTSTIPTDVRNAHVLLGITKDAPTEAEIRTAFRTKAKAIHPDTGGRGGDMDKLTRAKECALKFVGVK